MDTSTIHAAVMDTLKGIAPEVDAATLADDQPLRDQVDLDSMDWLNFLTGLHARLHVDIPESDYRRLTTLDRLVTYLAGKLS
jgi:acyl carrier protein